MCAPNMCARSEKVKINGPLLGDWSSFVNPCVCPLRRPTGTEATFFGDAAGASCGGCRAQEVTGMVGYMPVSVPRLAGHRLQGDDGIDGTALRFLIRKVLRGGRRRRRRRRAPWLPRCPRVRVDFLVVCGYGAVGKGSALALRCPRAQCSLLWLTGLKCSASWPVCTRRTPPRSSSIMAVASAMLVWLVMMRLTLCSLLASPGPGCSASWLSWTRRTPLVVRSSSTMAVACAWLVFLPEAYKKMGLFGR